MARARSSHKGVLIISTFGSEQSLKDIATELVVNAKLCACVNYTKVRSLYFWENELHDEEELIAFFKTTKGRVRELRRRLERIHPYDVPEILEIVVDNVSKSYLDWLVESTSSTTIRDKHRNIQHQD